MKMAILNLACIALVALCLCFANTFELADIKTKHEVETYTDKATTTLSMADTFQLKGNVNMPRMGLRFTHMERDRAHIMKLTKFALEFLNIRMIDMPYGNEDAVLDTIKQSNIKREDVFLVYKQNYTMFGTDDTKKEIQSLFERTGLDYIDLYLIHFVDTKGFYLQTWKTIISFKHQRKIRALGIGNVNYGHINYLFHHTGVLPSVVQLEVHPFFQQRHLVNQLKEHGVIVQAYSVLANAEKLHEPRLQRIAKSYEITVPQIMIRWCLQKGYSCLTRSSRINRLAENVDVFDFKLLEDDMQLIDQLEENFVTSFDPEDKEHLDSVDDVIKSKLDKRGIPLEVQMELEKEYTEENQDEESFPNEIATEEDVYSSNENSTTIPKNDTDHDEDPKEEEITNSQYFFSTDINLEPNIDTEGENVDLSYNDEGRLDSQWEDTDEDTVGDDWEELYQHDIQNQEHEIEDVNDNKVDGAGFEHTNHWEDDKNSLEGESPKFTESDVFQIPMTGIGEACKRLSKEAFDALKEAGDTLSINSRPNEEL